MEDNNHFAEVIASSLTGFMAQSWVWDRFPQFGSVMVITTKKRILFGIVHQVTTGSIDPSRYPFTYQKTEEELLQEQPQIFQFLKTTFSCLALGYKENGNIIHLLAPEPPKIHAFVGQPSEDLYTQLFSNMHYLHLIFSLQNYIGHLDELLLSLIHYQKQIGTMSSKKLLDFMRTYSLLVGNDYRRVKLFAQRLESLYS